MITVSNYSVQNVVTLRALYRHSQRKERRGVGSGGAAGARATPNVTEGKQCPQLWSHVTGCCWYLFPVWCRSLERSNRCVTCEGGEGIPLVVPPLNTLRVSVLAPLLPLQLIFRSHALKGWQTRQAFRHVLKIDNEGAETTGSSRLFQTRAATSTIQKTDTKSGEKPNWSIQIHRIHRRHQSCNTDGLSWHRLSPHVVHYLV